MKKVRRLLRDNQVIAILNPDMKLIGICSFPKSGNTWIREVIHSLFVSTPRNSSIVVDAYEGTIGKDVVNSRKLGEVSFYKSHCWKEPTRLHNQQLTNDHLIYIVRNPFDVFLSQANYIGNNFVSDFGTIEVPFSGINDLAARGLIGDFFSAFTVFGTLMPTFEDAGSWFKNAGTWFKMASEDPRVIILRYENLVSDFSKEFQPVADLLGFTTEEVLAALTSANDRCHDGGKFFFRKESFYYREFLNQDQRDHFKRIHKDVMALTKYSNIN